MIAKCFYACSLSVEMIDLLNALTFQQEESDGIGLKKVSYDFLQFSLDDLALKAKVDNDFLDEILLRYSSLIYGTASQYVKLHRDEDYNEVVIYLYNVIRKAVQIYDPSKGCFEHLSKRMLRLSLMHYASKRAQIIETEIKYFGIRVRDVSMNQLMMDSMASRDSMSEDIKLKIDIEKFSTYLTEQEKQIFELFRYGFTYREIGEKLHLSHSYVGFVIADILDNLQAWRDKSLI